MSWGQESYDTHAVHDTAANTTRMTVPDSCKCVRLSGSVAFDPSKTTGTRTARITKNGAVFQGSPEATVLAANASVVTVQTPALVVSPGDYFELQVEHTQGASCSVNADARTWFSMELL